MPFPFSGQLRRLWQALTELVGSDTDPTNNSLSPFNSLDELEVGGTTYGIYSLNALEEQSLCSLSTLPRSIKVVLEATLRNWDGELVTDEHVLALANWSANDESRIDIPFFPARIVLQDFTGVPLFVDLAAMREALAGLGGDPTLVNPLIPCDLVIDHSVQVDYAGFPDALKLNEQKEFERNKERYQFLKWASGAFQNVRVVPPSTAIVHQGNLEYLAKVIFHDADAGLLYPDSCLGTDSHTPMVNGLGVLAWGVGGLEAEAALLKQPLSLPIPDVIGIKLTGSLPEGSTATDLVLRITELCRKEGVVGKFIEFFGEGLRSLSVPDRATISNMAPEQGATVSYFPVDEATIEYLRLSGRTEIECERIEAYARLQGLWLTDEDPEFTKVLSLDLAEVVPSIAGPKRPHDRITLSAVGETYQASLLLPPDASSGYGLTEEDLGVTTSITIGDETNEVGHGMVALAAITSCTNTSNPSVMIAAALLARNAVERGLSVPAFVKTSLAPGSRVVESYLQDSGLMPYLEALGFHVVGFGCTTCIGNSGPLKPEVEAALQATPIVASSVLSGNRNFEGRIHPLTQTNYLASPPLVVAYALFGTTARDITSEPLGIDKEGNEVFLRDLWPSSQEIAEVIASCITPDLYKARYAEVWRGSAAWQNIPAFESTLYPWEEDSTYIKCPPFFDGFTGAETRLPAVTDLKVLGLFGDSVTTDHISPAGSIAPSSPAGLYLQNLGITPESFNSYGSRRGNDQVMQRGTFGNIRIKNKLTPGKEGNLTVFHPTKEQMSFFDASQGYRQLGLNTVIIAGKMYGTGSSRDWAAKGVYLLQVKTVIAESYERIHRSNLVGMGILPLQFKQGESASTLGLSGDENYSIVLNGQLTPGQDVTVTAERSDGSTVTFVAESRLDTPQEITYYRDGGILKTVLKSLL